MESTEHAFAFRFVSHVEHITDFNERFAAAAGLVAGIWLQTGSDCSKLDAGLEFLKAAAASTQIYGSVFLPCKK